MESRTIALSLLAQLVAFLVTAGAISALTLSGHIRQETHAFAFELINVLPALALGVTTGLVCRGEPALHALVASAVSWAVVAALAYVTVHRVIPASLLSASDLLANYAAPMLVSILSAYFTFSARSRSIQSSRADAPPLRGRDRR